MTAADALHVLVVDDEPLARRSVIRHLAAALPGVAVREARDGFEALAAIRASPPSLVLLDVEMPELSGLDVLRQLAPPRPKVVFVTAYEHFAVRAFEENACDYVVKPFTAERLERLALRSGTRIDVVAVADVSCFVSRGHYTYVHAGPREYISELSLIHFEERLDPSVFVRVHRSALVHVGRVVRVVESQPATVELDNGVRVPLSRRRRGALRRPLGLAGE